jgi:hypothetical protein
MQLGRLVDEEPPPLSDADVGRLQQRLRGQWSQQMTLDVAEVNKLITHIRWLERRLRRIEHAVSPLVEAITVR